MRGASVLVVDDDPDLRAMLTEVLSREGYVVHTASHGKEALALLQRLEEKPRIILVDLMMPVMTGQELIAALREVHALAEIPIAVVTGATEPGSFGEAPRLQKPIDLQALLRIVEQSAG